MSTKMKIIFLLILIIFGSAHLFLKTDEALIPLEKIRNSLNIPAYILDVKPSDVVVLKIKFRNAGAFLNPLDKRGISAVLGKTLLTKADNLSEEATSEIIENLGVGDIRIEPYYDHFYISFAFIKDNAYKALKFISSLLFEPKISDRYLETKKIFFPTTQNLDSSFPSQLAFKKLLNLLYKDSAYGLDYTGSSMTISGITAKDIESFIKENFTLQNLSVLFIGNLSKFDAEKYLTILFEKLPQNYKEKEIQIPENSRELKEVYIEKSNMDDAIFISFGLRVDKLSDLEKATLLIIEKAIFNDPFSDFAVGIREIGIANDIFSSVHLFEKSAMLMVSALIQSNDLQNYKTYLLKKLNDYKNIDTKTLTKAQKYFIENSSQGIYNFSDTLEEIYIKYLPFKKVTKKDFENLIKKLFTEPKIVIIKN